MASNRPKRSTSALNTTTTQKKILRIGIVHNGRLVEEKLLKKRGDVTIGRGSDNTFLIPSKDLPRTFKVFEETKSGYVMNFAKGMDARLAIDGKVFTLNQLLEGGDWVKKVGEYFKLDLSRCSRGKLVIGEVTILFHFVVPPPVLPKPQLPHVMWGLYALRQWLGGVFIVSVLGSVFVLTPLFIWLIWANYDPNWKPDQSAAQKIIRKALARHEVVEKKKEKEDKIKEDKGKKEGDADGKEASKAKAAAKPTRSKSSSDSGPKITDKNVNKGNVDKAIKNVSGKIKNIKIDVGNLKNLKGIPNLNAGNKVPNLSGQMANLNIKGTGSGSSGKAIGPIGASSSVKTIQAEGVCTGPTCTVATNQAFDPEKATGDNAAAFSGGGGGGGGGRPGRLKRGGGVPNINIAKINIMTPNIMLPTMKIKINLGGSMSMFSSMIAISNTMAPVMKKPPMATATSSGLVPAGAPLDVKKFLRRKKWSIVSCFKRVVAKGLVASGSRKTIRVTVSVSGGKIRVTGLGGDLASVGSFTSCVRGTLNGRSVGKSAEAKKFAKSWTFSLHLVGAASN